MPKSKPETDPDYGWLQQPAIFSDYFAVEVWEPGVVRFAFGEYLSPDEPPIWRAGIIMPIGDARLLAELLLKGITDFEKAQDSAGKNDDA